jgi:hypothetical protein
MQMNCANEEDSACSPGLSCMSLAECRAQLRDQQQTDSNILFRCNFRKHKVCCPFSSSQQEHPTMRLLPNENCGSTSELKITNGHNASFGQFPWMALLGSRCNVHQNVLCSL